LTLLQDYKYSFNQFLLCKQNQRAGFALIALLKMIKSVKSFLKKELRVLGSFSKAIVTLVTEMGTSRS